MGKGIPANANATEVSDGVRVETAGAGDLASYDVAERLLSSVRTPVLTSGHSPHSKWFVAAFDGTGNDMLTDQEATNVAKVVEGVAEAVEFGRKQQIGFTYVSGIGTQKNALVGFVDTTIGATYNARVERMYVQLMRQVADWRHEDPKAEISLAGIGFSRGAVQAAGFARLVHERGIQDPEGIRHLRRPDGHTEVVYTKPPLVPPGQVPQVLGLFDPVATGLPSLDDVRLPPSVLSAFQITAEDERRDWFPGMDIVPRGLSPDGRFLNVVVGGAHCDIGGGYALDGLSIRSGNLMVDYLNALADVPLLEKRPVPADPARSVVHRSDDHLPIYTDWRYRLFDGRSHQPATDGSLLCAMAIKCADPEPVDPALAARFEFRKVAIGPVPAPLLSPANTAANPAEVASFPPAAQREVDRLFERLAQAAFRRDAAAFDAVAQDYRSTEAGASWWRSAATRDGPSIGVPLALEAFPDPSPADRQAGLQPALAQGPRL